MCYTLDMCDLCHMNLNSDFSLFRDFEASKFPNQNSIKFQRMQKKLLKNKLSKFKLKNDFKFKNVLFGMETHCNKYSRV